jgi:cell division protein FtsI (penicillin-binding protein 3)
MYKDFLNKINSLLSASNSEEDHPREEKKFWKFWLVILFINIGLAIIVVRLFQIQIFDGEKYQLLAKSQHERRMTLRAERGIVYDRNGNLLAGNINTVSIVVDPFLLKNAAEICQIIARGTGQSYEALYSRATKENRRYERLARGVMPHLVDELYGIKDKGLLIISEPSRYYPYGEAGAQIIGFTDSDGNGLAGIELQFDEDLRGKDGYVVMQKDARQNLHESQDFLRAEPTNGKHINLTIDINLQRIVQYELRAGVEYSEASSASAVVIEPATGEILAIASYPSFDPNKRESIKSNNNRLRAITDEYAPGSTFKAVTISALLGENIVSENDSVDGFNGEMVFSWGRIKDVAGFKKKTFKEAVWSSSNIVMANYANKLEDRRFYSYIRDFGFGNKLEVDLPGEIPGKLKKPSEFYNSTKRYLGHGYDLTATPLQVANAFATIANGGVMMKTHIVSEIFSPDEDSQDDNIIFEPEKIRRVITPATAKRVRDLLIGVVDSGSGRKARIRDLKIAGKTGTSQKIDERGKYSKKDYIASFAGFFPAQNPKLAMIVIIDEPRKSIWGGSNAAPVFKRIAQRYMMSQNLETNPVYTRGDSVLTPNLLGMNIKDANQKSELLGIKIISEAKSGIVFFQNPKPMVFAKRNDGIRLTVMNPKDSNGVNYKKLDLRGLSLRRALNILQIAGIKSEITGSGVVRRQSWGRRNKEIYCKLTLR